MLDTNKFLAAALVVSLVSGCSKELNGAATPPASSPTVSLAIADSTGFEPGSGPNNMMLSVTLSSTSSQTVTVDFSTAPGSAMSGVDFSPTSGTLTFLAGETRKQIPVAILPDTPFDEPDETFTVTLVNPVGATLARAVATGTITDDAVRPDTGVTTCANDTDNMLSCPQSGYDQQDGESGRDFTNADNSDGRAGFSFTKLDSDGNPLPANAASWSCVRDEVTRLVWEIRPNDDGLRDRDHTYSWYNSDAANNGGTAGTQTGGTCTGGINCNTTAYAAAVNAAGLCGASDWRIPTTEELMSTADYGATISPAIDTTYFNDLPGGVSPVFWASESYANNGGWAWLVSYVTASSGKSSVGDKSSALAFVRLVRSP